MLMRINRVFKIGSQMLITALLIVFLCFTANAGLSDFEIVSENDFLELYIKESTTEIAVLVKDTGDIWYSNPSDRQSMETIARGAAKERQNSQLLLGYYVGNQLINIDAYTESVAHGQYEVMPIEDGVKVTYSIGQVWDSRDYLPLVISEEEFNELLALLETDKDRKFVRDQYALFSLEEGYEDPDNLSVLGVDFDKLFGEYGVKIEEPRFRANDKKRLIQEYLKAVQAYKEYSSLGSVKTEDIEALFDTPTLMLKWNVMIWDEDDMIALIRATGYSPENIIDEHLKYNVTPPEKNLRVFGVSIEYVLDGNELLVRIPSDEVSYPDKVIDPVTKKPVSFPLTNITVLPYFGAGNSQENGYLFVPDGSGALINMNNGKIQAQPYRQPVYGRDLSTASVREFSHELNAQIPFPVFGGKHENKAFLAIVESGDSFARINAEVAGMTDSYNKVYSSFSYIPNARVYMDSGGAVIYMRDLSINMYQARPYVEDMAIRYNFLHGENANYAGMASAYQNYLVEKWGLARQNSNDGIPFLVEFVGGIEKVQPVLGISKKVVKPITTFAQAETIVNSLLSSGVSQLNVRYSGWLNGGIEHTFPSRLRLETKIGTEEELKKFAAYLEEHDVKLYPNVNFLRVYKSSLFSGYLQFLDSARALNRKPAYLNRYNLATFLRETGEEIALLSPGKLSKSINGFMKGFSKLNIGGLSLATIAQDLYSDYRVDVNKLIDREQAKNIIVENLEELRNEGISLMVEAANVYALPYVDFVVKAPQYSRNYELLDRGIPFYQMVLRGYVSYSGEPANLSKWEQVYLLKILETGSVPYFLVSYGDSVEVKASRFENLYSINFEDRSNEMVDLYHQANGILKSIWNERIVDHQSLDINVYMTTYEGGTTVITNYNSAPVEVLGHQVLGYDYMILEGAVN